MPDARTHRWIRSSAAGAVAAAFLVTMAAVSPGPACCPSQAPARTLSTANQNRDASFPPTSTGTGRRGRHLRRVPLTERFLRHCAAFPA